MESSQIPKHITNLYKSLENALPESFHHFQAVPSWQQGFGGCLICRTDVKSGEELLRIPSQFFITMTVALNRSPQLAEAKKKLPAVEAKSILAFFLHSERNNPKSIFYNYLNAIPKTYTNPITWREQELILIRKELSDKYSNKIKSLQLQFKTVQEFLLVSKIEEKEVTEQKEHKEVASEFASLDEHNFLQLVSAIESRTLFMKNVEDPKSDVGAMVPLYDMANHTFMEGVDHFQMFLFDNSSSSYVMRSYRDLTAGEQIFITYGNYNNEHFLEYYGFLPFNNVREALSFKIPSNSLGKILGSSESREYISEKLIKNQALVQALLPHFFATGQLKSELVFEAEQESRAFSWQTQLFLQILAIDINLETEKTRSSSSMKEKMNKPMIRPNNKPKNGKLDEQKLILKKNNKISGIGHILEAFNANLIEDQPYFNLEIYTKCSRNLQNYLANLFKGPIEEAQKLLEQDSNASENSELAISFTAREKELIDRLNV